MKNAAKIKRMLCISRVLRYLTGCGLMGTLNAKITNLITQSYIKYFAKVS